MNLYRDRPNFFSGAYLDRRSEARESADWLAEARADRSTRYVVASGTVHLLQGADPPQVLFLSSEHPLVQTANEQELVLLGWYRETRVVLVELGSPDAQALPEGARFEELRPLSAKLAEEEASLLAYVRALSIWRSRHRFCSVCGFRTRSERAGHMLRCTNPECGHQFFPRIDPAIIVLVTDGERALLGRQASWPPGRYSTIAGFAEPGESLEDAVAREVFEETGVRLTHIEYHSSQPWPFPSSLMVGFHATAEPGAEIRTPEGGELEDAGWFTREQIASGTPLLPFAHSISYRLIQAWFDSAWPTPLASLQLGSGR
jgi:NAD+ diphosphatase